MQTMIIELMYDLALAFGGHDMYTPANMGQAIAGRMIGNIWPVAPKNNSYTHVAALCYCDRWHCEAQMCAIELEITRAFNTQFTNSYKVQLTPVV
jgi:hypothetical protein